MPPPDAHSHLHPHRRTPPTPVHPHQRTHTHAHTSAPTLTLTPAHPHPHQRTHTRAHTPQVGGGKPKMRHYFNENGWPTSNLVGRVPESEEEKAQLIDALQDWKTEKYKDIIGAHGRGVVGLSVAMQMLSVWWWWCVCGGWGGGPGGLY